MIQDQLQAESLTNLMPKILPILIYEMQQMGNMMKLFSHYLQLIS